MRERRWVARHVSRSILITTWLAIAGCDEPWNAPAALGRARQPIEVAAAADSYVRSGSPNQNQGTLPTVRLQSSGHNRGLFRFDTASVAAAVGSGTLVSAHLELTIALNAENWGSSGRTIDLHRLTTAWTELGATWNCAIDTDPADSSPDCATTGWAMDGAGARPWVSTPTATQLIGNASSGVLSLDVTADVAAFLAGTPNEGWILKKTEEGAAGKLELSSRESSSPPRLVLVVETGEGSGGGGGMGGGSSAASTSASSATTVASSTDAATSTTAAETSGSASSAADATAASTSVAETTAATSVADSSSSTGHDCSGVDPDDGNPCTIDGCSAELGVFHDPDVGAPCPDPDGNACTGAGVCDATAICVNGPPPVLDDGDPCSVDSCDPATGVRHVPCAPLVDAVTTTTSDLLAFLVDGPDAPQEDVAPGAIDRVRAAGLSGRVLGTDGAPHPGAIVRVAGRPDLGWTRTDGSGEYVLLVEGGAAARVTIDAPGHVRIDRAVEAGWQTFARLEDARLTPVDDAVTQVELDTLSAAAVARATTVTDEVGERTPTLIVLPGTDASMVFADGTTTPLSTISVRLTEVTVGPDGPSRMPAQLPPETAYTMAFEARVDEATAAGAESVTFDTPVAFHVENAHGIPVGTRVPVGSYDSARGAWLPEPDGLVIEVVGETAGLAELDLGGDGVAEDAAALAAAGITDDERAELAVLYDAGQTLWRVPLTHFSFIDCNFPYFASSSEPPPHPPSPDEPTECTTERKASIIECENQVLGERIAIAGTDLTLNYRSDRTPGAHRPTRRIEGDLVDPGAGPDVRRATITLDVAGRRFTDTIDCTLDDCSGPTPFRLDWDGLDRFGRALQGRQLGAVTWTYSYPVVYGSVGGTYERAFAKAASTPLGAAAFGVLDRKSTAQVVLGGWDARSFGVGGWTLSDVHVHDVLGRHVILGDGSRMATTDAVPTATRVFTPVGGPLAAGPDGSIYFNATNNGSARRLRPGATTPEALPSIRFNGSLTGESQELEVGPDGALYGFSQNRIFRLDEGASAWTHIAGNNSGTASGDGGPAMLAGIPINHIAVGPDGSIYVVGANRIRRIFPDGIIETIAGTGTSGNLGDGGPAIAARIAPRGLDVGADGSVVFANDTFGSTREFVRRVRTDGIIERVAGCTSCSTATSGALATDYVLQQGIRNPVVMPDGAIHLVEDFTGRVLTIRDGRVYRLAGASQPDCDSGTQSCIRGNPAAATELSVPTLLAAHPDGSLLLRQRGEIVAIRSPLPGLGLGEVRVPSADGREIYVFDLAGRHTSTRDAETGVTTRAMTYDPAGRIATITDEIGLTTTIERDGDGTPTAVVGPFGHRTELELDADGWLTAIANPEGETHEMTYHPSGNGLLATMRTPANVTASAFTFDEDGRLVRDVDPAGAEIELVRAPLADGWSVDFTTGMGRTTRYEVERLATNTRNQSTETPAGLVTTSSRSAADVTIVTRPDGTVVTTSTAADPRWGLLGKFVTQTVERLPSGLTRTIVRRRSVTGATSDPFAFTSITEDSWINPTLSAGVPTASSPRFRRVFTQGTRTETRTSPLGRVSTRVLDPLGRLVSASAPGVAPLTMSYDPVTGGVAEMVSGSGATARTTSYAYGVDGLLAVVENALGEETLLDHDDATRLTSTTRDDLATTTFTYDDRGNLSALTPPGRPAHEQQHTPVDLLSTYTPPPVPGAGATTFTHDLDRLLTSRTEPGPRLTTYDHDAAGRLETITFPEGQIVRTYHPTTGQLVGLEGPGPVDLAMAHDGALLTSLTWSGEVAGSVAFTHDDHFRVASETVNGAWSAAFSYDADEALIAAGGYTLAREPSTGRPQTGSSGVVAQAWTYAEHGELATAVATVSGAPLLDIAYSRDDLGRIATLTEATPLGTVERVYHHDNAGRLAAVEEDGAVVEQYGYDPNGNRVSSENDAGTFAATYDDQDRILTYGPLSFTHAPSGEVAAVYDASTDETTTYAYDAMGNLREVELPDGTHLEYLVDGEGRRVGKKVDGVLERGWLWRGPLQPVAELDASGAVVKRFVYAEGANVPELMVTSTATYRLVKDHLGSVRYVVDVASGAVVQELAYDAWGRVLVDTSPGLQPFGFAGGLYDPDTGLVRFGARDYWAAVGRWTTKDPIRFDGGVNLYAYSENDPANLVDHTGRHPEDGSEGGAAESDSPYSDNYDDDKGLCIDPDEEDIETDNPRAPPDCPDDGSGVRECAGRSYVGCSTCCDWKCAPFFDAEGCAAYCKRTCCFNRPL